MRLGVQFEDADGEVSGLTLSTDLSGCTIAGSESCTGFSNFLIHLERFNNIVRLRLD